MRSPRRCASGVALISLLFGCTAGNRPDAAPRTTARSFRIGDDVVAASATTVELRAPEGRVVAPRDAGETARFEGRSGSITGHEGPPPGWPRDFPLPSGGRPAGGITMRSDGTLLMVARYRVDGRSAASVSSELRRRLREQAPEADVVTEDGAELHVITFAGRWVGAVEIRERGSSSDVAVLLEFSDESEGVEGRAGRGGP